MGPPPSDGGAPNYGGEPTFMGGAPHNINEMVPPHPMGGHQIMGGVTNIYGGCPPITSMKWCPPVLFLNLFWVGFLLISLWPEKILGRIFRREAALRRELPGRELRILAVLRIEGIAWALPPRIPIGRNIGTFSYYFFEVSQCQRRRLAIHFVRPPPLDRPNTGGCAGTDGPK